MEWNRFATRAAFATLFAGTGIAFGLAGWASWPPDLAPNAGAFPTNDRVSKEETVTVPAEAPRASARASLSRIVFAADFATNGGCADHGTTDRCDLFTASLDLSTGAVSEIRQATSTPDASEAYPAWNQNGTVAYASVFKGMREKQVNYVDLSTGLTGLLVPMATWPEVRPDGESLLYVTSDTGTVMSAALSNGGLTVGPGAALTGVKEQHDPDFAPDGNLVVLHQIMADGAHGVILDVARGTATEWPDRTGHCAFGLDGMTTICDNSTGGGLFERAFQNGSLGSETLLADLRPSQLSQYDPAFSSCGGTSFNYPTFCGDTEHLLVSTSCNMGAGAGVTFSRLFLIDLSGSIPAYRPIGKDLSDRFAGPGKSSWTVDCITSL